MDSSANFTEKKKINRLEYRSLETSQNKGSRKKISFFLNHRIFRNCVTISKVVTLKVKKDNSKTSYQMQTEGNQDKQNLERW